MSRRGSSVEADREFRVRPGANVEPAADLSGEVTHELQAEGLATAGFEVQGQASARIADLQPRGRNICAVRRGEVAVKVTVKLAPGPGPTSSLPPS